MVSPRITTTAISKATLVLLLTTLFSLPHTLCAPINIRTKFLGKPRTIEIHPIDAFKTAQPLILSTTNTLMAYRPPADLAHNPNRLAQHQANTFSKVDQNGVPWARPPPPGHLDMEELLDERYYRRWEQLIRSGEVRVDPVTGGLYVEGSWEPVGPEMVEGVGMVEMVAGEGRRKMMGNGMEMGGEGEGSVGERYLRGEVKVVPTLWGEEVEGPERYVRKAYGLPQVEEEGEGFYKD